MKICKVYPTASHCRMCVDTWANRRTEKEFERNTMY